MAKAKVIQSDGEADQTSEAQPEEPRACWCGCGKTVGGKKSWFAVGHDARLKGFMSRIRKGVLSPDEASAWVAALPDLSRKELKAGTLYGYQLDSLLADNQTAYDEIQRKAAEKASAKTQKEQGE